MIRLNENFIASLARQPESGMGYQLVDLVHDNGAVRQGVAYNAELVLLESEPRPVSTRGEVYESLVKAAKPPERPLTEVRVRERPARASRTVMEKSASERPVEAKDAPTTKTSGGETFKRFSAYANDRRRLPDDSLSPGTFATTTADAVHAPTGTIAVQRYALANTTPASHVLSSAPAANTEIKRGTVAPANGQPGGGVEVIFPKGTQPATTTGPRKIPDV